MVVDNAEAEIEYNYLRKIEELRREREMLDNPAILRKYPLPDMHNADERYMSDEELLRMYESGSR